MRKRGRAQAVLEYLLVSLLLFALLYGLPPLLLGRQLEDLMETAGDRMLESDRLLRQPVP